MAGVVHHWPRTHRSRWQLPHTSIQGSLWRSSGISIRTSFICPVHIGCSQTCRGTWPWCSPLCRWHPTVWPLFTSQLFWVGVSSSSSYWLNPRVDVLEPALSQYRRDTIHLAWYEAQSCQERNGSALQSASIPDRTYIREESWFHYRSRVKHEGPYHQTLPVVLLPASSNTHGSTLSYIISHPNFGPCLHLHAIWFLQQPSLWDKCLPPWPSLIGPKFGCSLDPQNSQIRSDLGCNSAWPSLASGPISHSIQAQLHHKQLPGWPCTGVPDRAVPFRNWHSSKAQPSVIVPGSAPGPSISEGTIREKRFLRLLTTAVEPASSRHPTSPQRASTFPEETQNSLYATVHVMPLRIYVNSVNSTTTTILHPHSFGNQGASPPSFCGTGTPHHTSNQDTSLRAKKLPYLRTGCVELPARRHRKSRIVIGTFKTALKTHLFRLAYSAYVTWLRGA